MKLSGTLVSVGLPVRNGERTLEAVIRSILAQDHERIELVISDNASTDATETLCRDWAAADRRVVYHRQAHDVGILANFMYTMHHARGAYFRWIGDDDWIAPNYISRCVEEFADDGRLLLVTTQIQYTKPDASTFTRSYFGKGLCSDDPIDRLEEITSLLAGNMPIDPLYALMRRAEIAAIPRRNMIREDEVFATKLALAGPWGHVPDTLAHRHLRSDSITTLARRLGVPLWQARVPIALQCREMLRRIGEEEFSPVDLRRARLAVAQFYARRHYLIAARRARKLIHLASA